MPEIEIQPTQAPTPTPEATPQQTAQPNSGPDFDAELDSALSKTFEGKPNAEPKPEEKKIEKEPVKEAIKDDKDLGKEQPKDDGKLPDPETVVESPPGKPSAQSKEGWNALRNNYKKAHRLIAESQEEIKKLKATIAEKGTLRTKEFEELKKQNEELSRYRAMVDIQADPEFISQYDQPIQKSTQSIKEMLVSMNVSKDIVDQIDFGNTKLMDQIIEHVGEHRDKITARRLQRKVEEVVDLMEKRDETLTEHKSKYKEHLEQKKKDAFTKGAESEGRMLKTLEEISSAKDEAGQPLIPFLNKITPKDGATQAEADQAANHNRLVDLMNQKISDELKNDSPEGKAKLLVAAASAHWFKALNRNLSAKVKALEEELKKISTVGSETEKRKIPSNGARPPNRDMNIDDALAEHFANR